MRFRKSQRDPSRSALPTLVSAGPPSVLPPSTAATIGLQLDQLPADSGRLERLLRLPRQLGRELDQGEVRTDRDVAEVAAAQAALVGERSHDLPRLHLV